MVEIKCPFCGNMFTPKHVNKRSRSMGGNILKGAVFLPWGVVSAVKTKKSTDVICPHCKMTVQSIDR